MATQTAPLTECPTCGAKITRPELSLCSYCASPLGIGEKLTGADEATLARLARMSEHKDYAEAMSWEPNEYDDAPGAATSRRRGLVLIWSGLALAVVSGLLGWDRSWGGVLGTLLGLVSVLALAAMLAGFWLQLRGISVLGKVRKQPLQKRAAVVIDRRSETDPTFFGARTVYFFSLQFEDGTSGEYSFVGRGGTFEVPAGGTTGLACTRGARLLELLRLRV